MPAILSTLKHAHYWDRLEAERFRILSEEARWFIFPYAHNALQYSLRKLCLRLRWSSHPDEASYRLEPYFQTMRARVILGLLDRRMLYHMKLAEYGLACPVSVEERPAIERCCRKLLLRGSCIQSISKLIKARVSTLFAPAAPASAIESISIDGVYLRLPTLSEEIETAEMCAAMLPPALQDKTLQKDTCWNCLDRKVVTHMCCGCHLARYCSRECSALAWQEHKALCRSLQGSFSKGHHKEFYKKVDSVYRKTSRRRTYFQAVRAILMTEAVKRTAGAV